MNTSKSGGKYTMVSTHNSQIEEAGRYMAALELIGIPDAMAQRERIRKQLQQTGASVAQADQASGDLKTKKARAEQTNTGLDKVVAGVLAGLQISNAKLFAHLPDRANFPSTDPDSYADELAHALSSSNTAQGEVLGRLVHSVKTEKLDANREYQKAYDDQPLVQKGRASMAELGVLLKAAEVIIHNSAAPGSPAYQLLKKPRAPRKPAAGKKEEKGASGESSTSAATPTSAPTGSAAPTQAGSPPPAQVQAPTLVSAPTEVAANEAPAGAVALKVAQ